MPPRSRRAGTTDLPCKGGRFRLTSVAGAGAGARGDLPLSDRGDQRTRPLLPSRERTNDGAGGGLCVGSWLTPAQPCNTHGPRPLVRNAFTGAAHGNLERTQMSMTPRPDRRGVRRARWQGSFRRGDAAANGSSATQLRWSGVGVLSGSWASGRQGLERGCK